MPGNWVQFFLVLIAVWSPLLVIKSIRAIRTKRPYRLSAWDGGALGAGKELGPVATKVKGGLAVGCAIAAIGMLAGVVPRTYAFESLIVFMIVIMSIDFVAAKHPET